MSAQEAQHDAAVLHRIALSRYSTNVVHKTIALLNRIEKDVVARLARTDNESLAGQRLEQLLDEIRTIQRQGWGVIKAGVIEDLTDLAGNEIDFAQQLVDLAPPAKGGDILVDVFSAKPSLPQVMAAVNARPFQGRFLKDWLDGAEEGTARRVRDTIRQGFIEGAPTADIVRTLRGTKAAQYKDGVLETSRRGVEAMVRTAITHTANVAHQSVFEANADVVPGVIWTSTLDTRTTLICISRSEKVYPIDSGPRPPAHIGCRSVIRPQIADIPGVKPFDPPSYQDWLKKQPTAVQDDVLGPTKAKLFRSGGLAVDRFVDRMGHTLTLAELRARDSSAFKRAGL